MTAEFRKRLEAGETIEDIEAEAFAVVREAAKRVLGQRPYDVQIVGAGALARGMIAEMKTGEGKTLVSTMPAYLNALTGNGVHMVTVNDYLASRDADWMGADPPLPWSRGWPHPVEHEPRGTSPRIRSRHHVRHEQ